MPKSLDPALSLAEVNRVQPANGDGNGAVNEVHRLEDVPLQMAKADLGRAVGQAIEGRAFKEFGAKSLISGVVSGEKVPEYLARIYLDPAARRRLALALLKDDEAVTMRTVIEIDERKVG